MLYMNVKRHRKHALLDCNSGDKLLQGRKLVPHFSLMLNRKRGKVHQITFRFLCRSEIRGQKMQTMLVIWNSRTPFDSLKVLGIWSGGSGSQKGQHMSPKADMEQQDYKPSPSGACKNPSPCLGFCHHHQITGVEGVLLADSNSVLQVSAPVQAELSMCCRLRLSQQSGFLWTSVFSPCGSPLPPCDCM